MFYQIGGNVLDKTGGFDCLVLLLGLWEAAWVEVWCEIVGIAGGEMGSFWQSSRSCYGGATIGNLASVKGRIWKFELCVVVHHTLSVAVGGL